MIFDEAAGLPNITEKRSLIPPISPKPPLPLQQQPRCVQLAAGIRWAFFSFVRASIPVFRPSTSSPVAVRPYPSETALLCVGRGKEGSSSANCLFRSPQGRSCAWPYTPFKTLFPLPAGRCAWRLCFLTCACPQAPFRNLSPGRSHVCVVLTCRFPPSHLGHNPYACPFSCFWSQAAAKYGSSYEYPFSPNKPAPSILVCTPSFLHKYTNMKAIPLFCKVTASSSSAEFVHTPCRSWGDFGLYLEGRLHPSDPTDLRICGA